MKLREQIKLCVDNDQIEKIAEEFAKGFVKWCRSGEYNEKFTEKSISLNDLLEIYKKEKGL